LELCFVPVHGGPAAFQEWQSVSLAANGEELHREFVPTDRISCGCQYPAGIGIDQAVVYEIDADIGVDIEHVWTRVRGHRGGQFPPF
jgi:hypothetical protein